MRDSVTGCSLFAILKSWELRGGNFPSQSGREPNYEGAESKYKLDASNYIYRET